MLVLYQPCMREDMMETSVRVGREREALVCAKAEAATVSVDDPQ
jgi:hypothetical protein